MTPDFTEVEKEFKDKFLTPDNRIGLMMFPESQVSAITEWFLSKLTEAYARGRSDGIQAAKDAVPKEIKIEIDFKEELTEQEIGWNSCRDAALAELTKVK